jgi:hypothetical protein
MLGIEMFGQNEPGPSPEQTRLDDRVFPSRG